MQHLGKNLDEETEKSGDVVKEEPMSTEPGEETDIKPHKDKKKIPKDCGMFNGPQPRKKSVDGMTKEFGQLVVEEGRSRYVSNKFWNSMSEEVSSFPSFLCFRRAQQKHLNTAPWTSYSIVFDCHTDYSTQIAEMRDILDDPTDDEDDYPSPGSGSSASANHQGFIFSFSSTILSLRNFHPPANQVLKYWEVYKENVDPLVKILHRPSTEKKLSDAAIDLDHISKPLECMMFSIYFAAVTSLSDEECMNKTGMERESALKKYRFAFEQSMARAGFLSTTELIILQAFAIFLICVRRHDDTRFVWTLTGLLIRLAQSLGIHRDGEQFDLAPFETEMRRRLWWTLIHMDMRASEDHGTDPTIFDQSFDTRFPSNVNDEDIYPSMKEAPSEHEGATEMTFDLLRFTVSTTVRRMMFTPPGNRGTGKYNGKAKVFSLEHKERLVEELHQHIERKYLRHCDMNIPLHWVAGTVLRLVLAKMWLIIHHPLRREDFGSKELSEETKDRLFRTSVDIIQWSNVLEHETATKKWGWLFRTYVQWHAVAFVLSQLCIRTKGPEADRAWQVINEIFGDINVHLSTQKRGMLWKPLRKLMARAKAAREKEMEKQKMFPLDGTLGPAIRGVEAAMNPMANNTDYATNIDTNAQPLPPLLNNPNPNPIPPTTTNTIPPYLPLTEPQPQASMLTQDEYLYNDPAFPQTSQAFNMVATANGADPAAMNLNALDASPTGGAGDFMWGDWDEMMKDFPMGLPQDQSAGFGGGAMGGMTGWW